MRVLAFGACVAVGVLAQPEEVGPSVDPTVAAAIKAEWSVSAAAKKKEPRQKLTFVVLRVTYVQSDSQNAVVSVPRKADSKR
jgi:hypothetical protein